MAFMANESGVRPWQWHPTGVELELPTFATRGDAETWLGEAYPDLLEQGITSVTLTEGGTEVYGPMRLDEG